MLSVQPLVYRLICSNGLIASDRALRKTHVGRTLQSEQEAITVFRDDTLAGAALGGFDSPVGAVVGGLIVGVAESLTVQYGHYIGVGGIELIVPFGLILVVLLVKPNGLFGRTIVERV